MSWRTRAGKAELLEGNLMKKNACLSGLALFLASSSVSLMGAEEKTETASAVVDINPMLSLHTFAGLYDSASKTDLGFSVAQADLGSKLSWKTWQALMQIRALGSSSDSEENNRVEVRQAFIGHEMEHFGLALGRFKTGQAPRWGTWASQQGPDDGYGGTDGLALSKKTGGSEGMSSEYRLVLANAIGSSTATNMQAFGTVYPDFDEITTLDTPKQGTALMVSMTMRVDSFVAALWYGTENNRIVQVQTANSQRTEPTGAVARRFQDMQVSLGYEDEAWSAGVWMRRTIQSAAEKGMVESGGNVFSKGSFMGGQVRNELGLGAEMDWTPGALEGTYYSGFGYQSAMTGTDNLTVDQQIQEDNRDTVFVSLSTGYREGPFSLSGNLGHVKAKGEIFKKKGDVSDVVSSRSTFFLKASLDLGS
jgi:hypothetical protein